MALLLKQGADRETRDERGFTPLMLAIANGHVDVVAYLLEQGREDGDASAAAGSRRASWRSRAQQHERSCSSWTHRAKTEAAAKPAAEAARP